MISEIDGIELGLVEFEKCAILYVCRIGITDTLGLVEFEKCAILSKYRTPAKIALGLVEFEKCAIFWRS